MPPDLFDRRNRALRKHYDAMECKHAELRLTKRTIRNGAIQFVQQCQNCGEARSNPIKRDAAVEMNCGVEPPPFDESIGRRYQEARESGAQKIIGKFENRAAFERAEFMTWYDQYLKSPKWASIRDRVLRRANYLCEGCLENPAVLAHHTSYDHVGREFAFELLALCQDCHDRYHADDEPESEEEDDA